MKRHAGWSLGLLFGVLVSLPIIDWPTLGYLTVCLIIWTPGFVVAMLLSSYVSIEVVLVFCVNMACFGLVGEFVGRRVEKNKRRKRRIDGLCENCGYDLTGNESGKCPECGTAIEKP